MELFNLRLSYDVLQRITDDAKQKDRSASYIVRKILEDHYKTSPQQAQPATKDESKPPKKVEQTTKPKENSKPTERPLSRSELFRSISKNRA